MRYCQVGCDLDGVLVDGFTPPEADFTAISGRNIDDWERTIAQIGTLRPIYLKPPDFPGNSGVWKATMIRLLGIAKFYEDMPDQASQIKLICPDCEVVMVKGGQIVGVLD